MSLRFASSLLAIHFAWYGDRKNTFTYKGESFYPAPPKHGTAGSDNIMAVASAYNAAKAAS